MPVSVQMQKMKLCPPEISQPHGYQLYRADGNIWRTQLCLAAHDVGGVPFASGSCQQHWQASTELKQQLEPDVGGSAWPPSVAQNWREKQKSHTW